MLSQLGRHRFLSSQHGDSRRHLETPSGSSRPSRLLALLAAGGMALAGLLANAPTAAAADGGTIGECMVARHNTTKPAKKTSLQCTSNDVRLAQYEKISGPDECAEGETIIVVLKGQFEATSDERWDVGVFVSTDGGDPNALGGTCYQDFLHPGQLGSRRRRIRSSR